MKLSFGILMKASVAIVAVAAKATAALVPGFGQSSPAEPVSAWADMHKNFENGDAVAELNPEIASYVAQVDLSQDLEPAVRVSYAMAATPDLAALDELWIKVLAEEADSAKMTQFIALRGNMNLPESEAVYLDNWLQLAAVPPGGCDGPPGGDGLTA